MYKILFILFSFFQNSTSFSNLPNLPNNVINTPKIINNNKINCLEINDVCNILDNILQYKIVDDTTIGRIIVEQISSLLPKVDSIGHNILSANDKFILYILNNNKLTDEMQKDIILWSIKLAQSGDDMGSKILELYYNTVDKCL